jgi:hypothetical protein
MFQMCACSVIATWNASASVFWSALFYAISPSRFDYNCQDYVAGVLEEDASFHGASDAPSQPERCFTLYLYDREEHQVRLGLHSSF